MIDYETFCKIKELRNNKGLNTEQIARGLALNSRTVRKWLSEERFRLRKSTRRPSNLDPFKQSVEPVHLDNALQDWNQRYGQQDESLAIDGKTMCNAIDEQGYQTHIMSAVGHQTKTCYTQKKSALSL